MSEPKDEAPGGVDDAPGDVDEARQRAAVRGQLIRSQKELDRKTRILSSVLDSMADAVIVADREGNVLVWNPAAERPQRQRARVEERLRGPARRGGRVPRCDGGQAGR